MRKPVIYIASPYTTGDCGMNVRVQLQAFDQLMNGNCVWPVAPLWMHFQHIVYPRPYEDWMAYDLAMIELYDGCLRLDAYLPEHNYMVGESAGADREVRAFQEMGKPVFYSIVELYEAVSAKSFSWGGK